MEDSKLSVMAVCAYQNGYAEGREHGFWIGAFTTVASVAFVLGMMQAVRWLLN